ncbi:MAG TPA: DUF302 domain-containing protein [Candidatus Elarobacter sp.]|jgi:uncharacterized protein (DUF302 family)|nr:DUF302 domain-containing protein [Candidatus Elarobacter sp.]
MAIVGQSRYSFDETVALLCSTITAAGNTVFATIDQAAAASTVGLTLRPTTLIVFGNPKAGTGLMQRFPSITLDLPLKIAVWDDAGTVSVAYEPMSEIATRHAVPANDPVVHAIDANLAALAASVCSRP